MAGNPPNIKDTDHMKQLWSAYKSDLKSKESDWVKIQYVGVKADRVTDGVKLPYTFEGFKRYCWDEKIGCVEQYFTNQDGLYEKYIGICSRIKNEIKEHQIIGGMNGFFNPSITQRLNGLVDKKETTINAEPRVFNLPDQED
tara:strand:+ start:1427 stop:1852 length:426 start_codon:yes stop_codon:yes gene_type:complete